MKPRIKMLPLSFALSCAVLGVSPLRAAQLPPRQELVDLLWHERFDELEKLTREWCEEKLGLYAGWLGIVAVVAAVVWSIVRNHQKPK